VAATRSSRELVLCVASPSAGGAAGAVPVRLLSGDAVHGSAVAFAYRAAAIVRRVHPSAGARGGGTAVRVYGAGFAGASSATCRFAGASVPAVLLSPGALECVSPAPAAPGYASVEVSMNGQDYSAGGVHFEYQPPASVRALEPSRGPVEGGALVNVTGSGISRRAALLGYLRCRFNATSVAAAWRRSAEAHCVAPAHASGVVRVELTQDEQQHTRDGARFEYELLGARSVHPGAGPLAGGTLVEVRGAGLEPAGARGAFCQFGSSLIPESQFPSWEEISSVLFSWIPVLPIAAACHSA
jgi:hypothetical protein